MHFAFLTCLLLYICATLADIPCRDPQGIRGYCKRFADCKHLMYMIGERNIGVASMTYFNHAYAECKKKKAKGLHCCRHTVIQHPCGEPEGNRIAHGTDANLLEFGWMVRLSRDDSSQEGFCGGSLIDAKHVITAAHCTASRNKEIYVVLGEHDTKLIQDCIQLGPGEKKCAERTQIIKVDKIIKHDDYNSSTGENDIALLILKTSAHITGTIQPICLPTIIQRNQWPKSMIISGWGATDYSRAANILQKTEVQIIPNIKCSEIFKKPNLGKHIFCAHSKNDSATCKGDSGGPLIGEVTLEGRSRFYQFGLIVVGSTECTGKYPSKLLNITSYIGWIEKNKQK